MLVSSRSYPQDGTFPVSLTVTDTAGSLASDQIQVTVSNVAPTVLTATDLTGAVGAKLDFAATLLGSRHSRRSTRPSSIGVTEPRVKEHVTETQWPGNRRGQPCAMRPVARTRFASK